MADKAAKSSKSEITKGPSMVQVICAGVKTWANRTGKGLYRCTKCKAENHEKAR